MLRLTQIILLAVCAASIAAAVKVDRIELSNSMPFLRLKSQGNTKSVSLECHYTLDDEDADIHIYWTKDGEKLKDAPALAGRRKADFELVNINRDDEGVYQCKVTSGANSDHKDFNLVVYQKMKDAAADVFDVQYTHYDCKVSYKFHLTETYPARVAYCGVKKGIKDSNKRDWLQEPFASLPAGEPQLGFSSKDSDWLNEKTEKLQGDFYTLSLNKSLDVRDMPHTGLLYAACEWFVADKEGNQVELLMDSEIPLLWDGAVGSLNSCPAFPFLAAEEKDTVTWTYGDHVDNCRGVWRSDDNIISSLTCKRTGDRIDIGCYGNQWEVALNDSTKKEIYTSADLDKFTTTCGEGRLLPVFGLIIAAILFNLTSK